MRNSIFVLLILILCLFTACQEKEALQWNKEANGVWRCSVGNRAPISLLEAAGITPRFESLNEMSSPEFPLDKASIRVVRESGYIYLSFPLDREEVFYGLGLQFTTVSRRGNTYELHVDHYGGKDNGRTHAPVPFYISSNGYGVLIDAAQYIKVYAGSSLRADSPNPPEVYDRNTDAEWTDQPLSDAVKILVPADGCEILVFGGPSPMEAVMRSKPLYWQYEFPECYNIIGEGNDSRMDGRNRNDAMYRPSVAVRSGNYALRGIFKGKFEVPEEFVLFDVVNDPEEKHELSKQKPELFEKLKSQLINIHKSANADRLRTASNK